MSIVTKKGDGGTTKLFSGETVSKSDPLLDVVGTIDELIASLGLARSLSAQKELSSEIRSLEIDLMKLAAGLSKRSAEVDVAVSTIEERISDLERETRLPRSFLVPGTTPCASAIELSRTVARRLERIIVAAKEAKICESTAACIYMNRLSDYLFLLARHAEKLAGVPFDPA